MNSDVTGVVTDATGGVIPGVTVIATNERNRAQRSAVTDDLGVYRLAGIQPGTYTVEAELTGFKRSVQTGIVVSPGLLRRVEIVLDVGEVTDSVIVTDEVPVLQTSNATISTALPSQVRDKPIASMTRGALLGEQMIWAAGSAAGGVYGFVGNRADMNQYNVEGMQYNFISSSVSNNIIEEVSVVLSNAPAEYARPVTLNATLKSGTNEYHAEYWMAGVNPCLNALRSPFSPARASRAPCVTAKRQFFNVSGPILKDRVFFFYSWARPNSFSNLSNSRPQSFPSLRMQGGDFSLYPSKIIDPTTGEQFPGNVIPAGRISPVAQAIMNDFMGSSVNYLGAPESYTNNVQQLAGRYRQDNDHNIKTDFNVGENDSFSFHAVRHKVLSNTDRHHPSTGTSNALHTTLQDNVFNWQSGVTHNHVFGPGLINQMRLGVTRFVYIHRQLKDWEGDAESAQGPEFVNRWGLQGVAVPDLSGMPHINIGGWLRTYFDNESATYDSRYSFFNDLSVTEGRHNIKIGMSAVKLLEDGPARGNYFGAFNFSNIFTGAQVANDPMTCAAPAVCGDAFADFLLGLPSSSTRYQPRSVIARRKWEWGAFIQDDWNVTDKLNLSYGLRWSRYTVPYDKNGMFYNFDPESLSIVVRDEFARERIHPSWPTNTFPVILASEAGFPSKLIEGSNNWQPRVGFAYRITPSSVLRGGWGIYNGASRFLPLQAFGPFVVSESFTNEVRSGSATGALYSWPHAFPTASDIITVSSAFGFAKDYHEAWTHNWNVTYEREVATNWGVQLTYRGVRSNDLLWGRNLNAIMASGTPWSRDRLPWPNLSSVNFVENGGDSIYNGIEFRLTHPWVNGLHSQLSLTKQWSGRIECAHLGHRSGDHLARVSLRPGPRPGGDGDALAQPRHPVELHCGDAVRPREAFLRRPEPGDECHCRKLDLHGGLLLAVGNRADAELERSRLCQLRKVRRPSQPDLRQPERGAQGRPWSVVQYAVLCRAQRRKPRECADQLHRRTRRLDLQFESVQGVRAQLPARRRPDPTRSQHRQRPQSPRLRQPQHHREQRDRRTDTGIGECPGDVARFAGSAQGRDGHEVHILRPVPGDRRLLI